MREAEVAIFVTRRGRSEVLIAHRSPPQGAYWHTIAGGIEAGETPLEAAVRELAEETGLSGVELHAGADVVEYAYPLSEEPPERAALYPERAALDPERAALYPERAALYPEGLVAVRVHCFVAEAPDDWEPMLDWEHDDHRWCAPGEAAATLRWPETAAALRRLVPSP